MPISRENKARYPAAWLEIRAAILERAGHKCEECGVPDRARIVRRKDNPEEWEIEADLLLAEDYEPEWNDYREPVEVVLTIGHLDHNPETTDPALLRSWCQLHHNRYDAAFRAQNRKANRLRRSGQQSLFDNEEVTS